MTITITVQYTMTHTQHMINEYLSYYMHTYIHSNAATLPLVKPGQKYRRKITRVDRKTKEKNYHTKYNHYSIKLQD